MQVPFVHLHNHTAYSLHDGASLPEELIELARRLRFSALALTDHANMHAAPAFFDKALASGIKPILGCEIYVRTSTPPVLSPANDEPFNLYHLPLLVQNTTGYRNLCRLISSAKILHETRVPSIDLDVLRLHAEGLIGMSGCLRGQIPRLLLADRKEEAAKITDVYADIFGRGNFFIELMDHGKSEEKRYLPSLVEIARRVGLPIVATNDTHFPRVSDFERQELLIAISQGRTLASVRDFNHYHDTYYLRPYEEMSALFSEFPEALRATVAIADKCNFRLDSTVGSRPRFPTPPGVSEDSMLADQIRSCMNARGLATDEYAKRLEAELDVIIERRLAGLFLFAWDLMQFAGASCIPCTIKGIAPSSLVAYILGISDIDPIEVDLPLDGTMMSDHRVAHFSIEVFFERRQELMDHLLTRYGVDQVAHIIEFSWFHPRTAIRECARALEADPEIVESLLGALPPDTPVHRAEKRLRQETHADESVIKVIDAAKRIESLVHHYSPAHGSSVVLSQQPLVDLLPASRLADGTLATHYGSHDLDRFGFLRVDFHRNNRELGMIGRVSRSVPEPKDDSATFALLQSQILVGVTPLDLPIYRSISYVPRTFADLIVMIAIGKIASRDPTAAHAIESAIACGKSAPERLPELGEILAPTGGLIIFHEQVEAILQSFSDGSVRRMDVVKAADDIRDALARIEAGEGPPALEDDGSPHPLFVRLKRAARGRVLARRVPLLWDLLMEAAPRLLSKASKAATALQTYRIAYLKAHYPVHFMAALLTDRAEEEGDFEPLFIECHRLSIGLLPPDINQSEIRCCPVGDAIQMGFVMVPGLGEQAALEVQRARTEAGSFVSFSDFLFAFDHRKLTQHSLEALIKAGCFDCMGLAPSLLLLDLDQFLELKHSRERVSGQSELFELERSDAQGLEAEIRKRSTHANGQS